MTGSILVVTFDTATGIRTGRLVGSTLLEDNAVTSGKLASGIIGAVHLRDLNVTSAKLAATLIASIEAGVADGGVTSAKLASGAVGGVLLQDAGVLSGKIAPNAIGGAKVWDFGLVSGKYASGSITEQALVSGISIDIAETVEEPGYRAREAISSYCCVFVAALSGNYVGIAKALSGSMPAIGIAGAAIASGALGVTKYGGRMAAHAEVVSGQYGRPVYVGSDGQLKTSPPSTSGYCQQIMGTVKGDNEIMLFPEPGYIELT